MAQIIKAPNKVEWSNKKSVFLSGSIDGDVNVNWHIAAENALKDLDILVFNPRRDDWDSSWKESIEDPQFKEQVEWELDQLDSATHILMYFSPNEKSPITLLELGLHAVRNNIVLVCSKNFWRRGNVEIVAARYNIPLYENLEQGLEVLREKLLVNTAHIDEEQPE